LKNSEVIDGTVNSHAANEEFAHALSHGFGLVASVVAVAFLIEAAWSRGTVWHVIGCAVFGGSMVLVYAASTLYHSARCPDRKRFYQRLDHIAIYLLIAGTYTPFALVKMQWPEGSALLLVVWSLAAFGIAFEFVQKSKKRYGSLVLYNVMGWLVILAAGPLQESMEPGGVALLLVGGAVYAIGVVFYIWERLPYNHAIWHGFVLGGSACHLGSVFSFVLPS
jgi:hemolysin III